LRTTGPYEVSTTAMGVIVAHNSAHHRGECSLTAVMQRCALRTRAYVQLSELSYCLPNVRTEVKVILARVVPALVRVDPSAPVS